MGKHITIEPNWFGVCSSVLHARLQAGQENGLFAQFLQVMDFSDVREIICHAGYQDHIKRRRPRGEQATACAIPGETQYPARRRVVKRTLSWLSKRRSLKVRWCKKAENWLAFVQFACAHILSDMTVYG